MSTSNDQIFEAIGSLKAEVVGLRRDFEVGERKSERLAQEASNSRAALYKRVDEVAQRTATLESEMLGVKEDLKEVKVVADDVTRWKHAGVGALFVTGIAASSITAGISLYWQDIWRVLTKA